MAGNYSPAHVPMSPPGAAMARGSSLDTAAQGAEWGGGAVSWPEVSGPGAPTTLQDHFGARDGGAGRLLGCHAHTTRSPISAGSVCRHPVVCIRRRMGGGIGASTWSTRCDAAAPTLSVCCLAPHAGNLKAVVFGLINGAVGLPALIAFAAIVFQDPTYTPYLGALCKLFFLSSAVHQFVFCWLSTLPFAIGQVQDVGEGA